MQSNEELLAEVNGMNLPEQMKEMFRRVINTVESELTEDQWRDYEIDLDKYQRTMSEFRTAREEGREEGLEEGRAEGRAEGLAEGRAARQLEIARAMKEKGLSAAVIADCTGIAIEAVEKL